MRKLTLALLASAALSIAVASDVWAGPAPATGIVKSTAATNTSVRRGRGVVGRRGLNRGGARYVRRGGVYVGRGGYSTGGTAYTGESYTGGGAVYGGGAYVRHGGVYAGRGLAAGRRRPTPGARLYAGRRGGMRRR